MNSLVVENNHTISRIIQVGLKSYGYSVDCIKIDFTKSRESIISELNSLMKGKLYSLIMIDTSSSFLNNQKSIRYFIEILRNLKKDISIIGITQVGQLKNKIDFLNAGGDDAISYPFMMQELLARIQSLIRRPQKNLGSTIKLNDVEVDTTKHVVIQKQKSIPLKKKEYNLIEYMALNKNRPISRTELLDHVWDYKRIISSNTVDVHINNIRRKLVNPNILSTVHGFGYMLKDENQVVNNEEEIINKGIL